MTNNAGNIISNSQVVFIDDFRSEYDTRVRKGGVPTNVTYNADGTVTLTTSEIKYANYKSPFYTWSLETLIYYTGDNGAIVSNGHTASDYSYFFFSGHNLWYKSKTGSTYQFTVYTFTPNTWYHIVATHSNGIGSIQLYVNGSLVETRSASGLTTTGTCNISYVGSRSSGSEQLDCKLDYVRLHQTELSTNQISNLYNKKTYQALTPMSEQLGGDIILNPSFDSSSNWNGITNGWSISGGFLVATAASLGQWAYNDVGVTVGDEILIVYKIEEYSSGGVAVRIGGIAGATPIRNTNDTFYERIIAPATGQIGLRPSSALTCKIPYFHVYKIEYPSISILSNLRMTDGEVKDDYNTITNSNVSIVQAGGKTAGLFDGKDSKIDLGSDIIGTKNVLGMGWVLPYNSGENSRGHILSNGKLMLYHRETVFNLSSDGDTTIANTAGTSPKNGKMQFIAFTRQGNGIVNIYVGYTNSPPSLAGTANQSSGTPVNGTSNLLIGNRAAQDRTWNGLISDIHIEEFGSYDETALKARLTQYWSLTRKNK